MIDFSQNLAENSSIRTLILMPNDETIELDQVNFWPEAYIHVHYTVAITCFRTESKRNVSLFGLSYCIWAAHFDIMALIAHYTILHCERDLGGAFGSPLFIACAFSERAVYISGEHLQGASI